VKTVPTDGNYLFRRVGMHWCMKVCSVFSERKLRKCVRYDWERFRPFVPVHPIQNNMQLHINAREDNKACVGRKWSV
jgi:hypothetical protein